MTDLIGESFTVPGNSSRFFTEKEIAINQTKGKIQLACITEDPYIYITPNLMRRSLNMMSSTARQLQI
jgi:hypothetical protein